MDELLQKPQLISSINYANWSLGLLLLLLFTWTFQWLFRNYALVASNRRLFASHFFYYSISIFLIITTIKSSLALSLGLVGALSIIRFRTAIKEPEQLIFLLGLTAVSIALAAEQFLLSTFCVILFVFIAIIRNRRYQKHQFISQDFALIQFQNHTDSHIQAVLEQLLQIHGVSSLVNYESHQNTYKILFQLENPEIQIITDMEQTLTQHNISEPSIKLTQSMA
jgi:hypothetical protein